MARAQWTAADLPDLSGRTVVVTGASGGLGKIIATELARVGASVTLAVRDMAKGRAAAGTMTGRTDVRALNLADLASVRAFAANWTGDLDILINNAGIMRDRSLKKMTEDDWQSVLRVNLTGAYHCIQQAAPLLRSGGRIVNIASVAAHLGFFGQANYAASKAGLIALTKVAARELARQGVTANAIAPGVIDTEMGRMIPPEVTQKFIEQIPLGRLGQIEDVVNVAMFLCSPLSAYLTGQVLNVNGGFYMP